MDFSGWEIDLPSLYGPLWEKRAKFHLSEKLYPAPNSEWAILFFGIGEVGLNKQVGPIALFRGKQTPQRIYHSGERAFWYEGLRGEPVQFSPEDCQARVFEFLPGPPGLTHIGFHERTLDFETGALLPLPHAPPPPPAFRGRWRTRLFGK